MFDFILGVVQGLSEFLPISSSGHISLLNKLMNNLSENLSLSILVHVGTVFSIFVYYFRSFVSGSKVLNDFKLLLRLARVFALGLLPAAVVGVLFKSQIESIFINFLFVPIGFLLTASVLLMGQKFLKEEKGIQEVRLQDLSYWPVSRALAVGLAQCLSILPGVSRSGLTISTALICGASFHQAAFFSFLISIPIILGGGLLSFFQGDLQSLSITSSIISFSSSFIFGLLGLHWVHVYLKSGKWYVFALYLMILSFVSFYLYFSQ